MDYLFPNVEAALDKGAANLDGTNLIMQLGSNDVDELDSCIRVTTRRYPNLGG
jgi:hypothetical protein